MAAVTVATCLWDANEKSFSWSTGYNEKWVNRLYHGFKRNLTRPFRFVVFVDRLRELASGIDQELLTSPRPIEYGALVEPFKLNEPMIFAALDTVIVGNVDHFVDYCFEADQIALPHPEATGVSNNGVAFVPAGKRFVYDNWEGQNDMEWMRLQPHSWIDVLWPRQVVSLKIHAVRNLGLGDARIVYFHGLPKPNHLKNLEWIKEHWLRDSQ